MHPLRGKRSTLSRRDLGAHWFGVSARTGARPRKATHTGHVNSSACPRWRTYDNRVTPTLAGYGIALRPLSPADAAVLQPGIDPDFWRGMTVPVPATVADLAAQFADAAATPGRESFAVVGGDGRVVGTTSFYDVTDHRLEIGHTFYLRQAWGTRVNPAAKMLLLTEAFERRRLDRVALRCDARNARSRAAIQKLGAVYEGTLRAHRRASDGVVSDTSYYSIIAAEWPAVKSGLLARLG